MKKILIIIIKMYQKISKNTKRVCRFYPTCSQYAIQAIEKYGVIKGVGLAIYRILRCNPFSKGGFDPIK